MEIITIEKKTFEVIEQKFEQFVTHMDELCTKHNRKVSEWLDNADVCRILNISKRTLQTYRDNGTIPYAQINHKMFYKPSDVEKVLDQLRRLEKNIIKMNISPKN